jgi:hypothetical protein
MAISHELSGEIATALFAAKDRSPRELNDLKEMVFAIHRTLEQLGDEAPTDQTASQSNAKKSAPDTLARHKTTGKS